MIDLNEITVFNDIRERLAAMTPERIAAIGRKLKKYLIDEDDQVIGVIESDSTRALYVLSRELSNAHMLEHAKADCAEDETIAEELNQRAAALDSLADVARELFWAQAKTDLGFYGECDLAIKTGWRLVETPEELSPPEALRRAIEGRNRG